MFRKTQIALTVVALLSLSVAVQADTVQLNSTADPGYQYTPSSEDLINDGQASLDHVVWTGYDTPPFQLAPLSAMNDGTAGAATDPYVMVTMDGTAPSGFFFLKGSSTGYDVTEINCYACWYAPRNMQRFQVFYSLTSDPPYVSGNLPHQLGSDFVYTETLPENQIIGTKISLTGSDGKLLSGVTAIQFTFLDAGTGYGDPIDPNTLNRSSYREIDVIGSPTVPEPSGVVLVATAIVGLIAYAWRKRR